MIYELRRYDINRDRLEGYREWVTHHAFPVFHGQFHFPTIGFFEVMPLEGREQDAYDPTVGVRWILAWESVEERDRRWEEVGASDAWARVVEKARDDEGSWLFHVRAEMVLLEAWPEWDMTNSEAVPA